MPLSFFSRVLAIPSHSEFSWQIQEWCCTDSLLTKRAARLCTLSMPFICFWMYGSHVQDAYSSCGLNAKHHLFTTNTQIAHFYIDKGFVKPVITAVCPPPPVTELITTFSGRSLSLQLLGSNTSSLWPKHSWPWLFAPLKCTIEMQMF